MYTRPDQIYWTQDLIYWTQDLVYCTQDQTRYTIQHKTRLDQASCNIWLDVAYLGPVWWSIRLDLCHIQTNSCKTNTTWRPDKVWTKTRSVVHQKRRQSTRPDQSSCTPDYNKLLVYQIKCIPRLDLLCTRQDNQTNEEDTRPNHFFTRPDYLYTRL